MLRFFQNIVLWIYIKFHTLLIYIGISLYRTEEELLKANPNNLNEKDKKTTRKLHSNPILENFYAGKHDEKYTKDYYEILKSADKFKRNATPFQMAVAADKYTPFYGKEDKDGIKHEHFGFYDDKHKNKGKTLNDALKKEYKKRRTNDDKYQLLYIFDNKPIETGFAKILDVIEKTQKENADFEYEVVDIFRKSKQYTFPIKVFRDNIEVENKIEQLTEFLHIKKIGFEYRQLEFFVPLKFKTIDVQEDDEIFKELINIKEVFVNDEYGKLLGFGIIELMKRIKYNNTHEVWKFKGIEMKNMNLN